MIAKKDLNNQLSNDRFLIILLTRTIEYEGTGKFKTNFDCLLKVH